MGCCDLAAVLVPVQIGCPTHHASARLRRSEHVALRLGDAQSAPAQVVVADAKADGARVDPRELSGHERAAPEQDRIFILNDEAKSLAVPS
jgi:hypothetical protein